jgi:NAD(P)-dependent dehydrogenase (short-subunit alcohol dehydrogenase family)
MSAVNDSPLAGQVAIVTGSGRGIGRAHIMELARSGAAVVVNDIAPATADRVANEVRAAGGTALASSHDVSDRAQAQALVDLAIRELGSLEILINNAGSRGPRGIFEDLSIEEIYETLDVHLMAAFHVTQPAWRYMKSKGYGRVLLTSSAAGMFSYQGSSSYAVAKAGIYGLTKALAFEGLGCNMNVNVLLPWAASAARNSNPVPSYKENYDYYVGTDVPSDHWSQDPALVAPLAAYLVDPRCSITGEAFSYCRSRYGRVFVGVTNGWMTANHEVTAETIEAHIEQIRDRGTSSEPQWVFDELSGVLRRLGLPAGRKEDRERSAANT